MKKTRRFVVILTSLVALCYILAPPVQAGPNDPVTQGWATNSLVNKYKAAKIPIWQITQEGTAKAVNWVNAHNPRFAVYDPGTPEVETDDAVLDKETGLVWEQTPDITSTTWGLAVDTCIRKEVVGRLGWRLPRVEELASLVDRTQTNPTLPAGHPFSGVQSEDYWSATTTENSTDRAWAVNFAAGFANRDTKATVSNHVWCVRGGQGYDGGLY